MKKNDLEDTICFQEENPKRLGSASYRRYSAYCRAKTVREALFLGATRGDIKWDEAAGYFKRGPTQPGKKLGKTAMKSKAKKMSKNVKLHRSKKCTVMPGIHSDGNGTYIAERYFCYLGVQARKHKSVESAQAALKAIDRFQAGVQARIHKKIMAGETSSLEDFCRYVKAAVADERKASPDMGVDGWRYYSKHQLAHPGWTKAALRQLRKDPRISLADVEIRVLQGNLEDTLRGYVTLCTAKGLRDIDEIVGVDGLNAGRNAATELAREALAGLKKGEFPSDAIVLKALRLWGFDKSTSRQNVLPKGHEWVHSDTLGIIENRSDHQLIVSSPCKGHEYFVNLLSAWARKRSPNGALPFTTISLNKNYAGRLHRDSGNIGPSVGVAAGPYTGGGLRFWAGDSEKGKRSSCVEQVRKEKNLLLNIKKGIVFDGNCAHEVEPFKGERYSLIFFTIKKYKKTSDAVKRKMVHMGADWPNAASLKRLQAEVPLLPKGAK